MVDAAQPQAPVPGSPDHDAAMVAKFNAANGIAPEPKPDAAQVQEQLLGGKFKSPEDLLAAYQELERKLSAPAAAKPPVTPPADAPKEGEQKPEGAKPALEAIDYDAMSNEVASTGNISDASREALKAAGLPDKVIDQYVRSAKAEADVMVNAMHTEAGGKEAFESIREWAFSTLPDSTKEFLASQYRQGGETAKEAVRYMKSQFEAANGKVPSLIQGKSGSSVSGGFASQAEMTAAMRDPRYANDPAYRTLVAQKIASASF